MQGAKLIQAGAVEATGLFSSVSRTDDGESTHLQNHIGLRTAIGVHDKLNLRFSYENAFGSDIDAIHVLMIGSKAPIMTDWVALYIPLSVAFGSGVSTSESWQLQPTALFTVPLSDNLEFNPSAKWIVPFSSDQGNLIAVNFGAGISTNIDKWVLRPEIGLLYDPGSGGHNTHYSLGISFYPLFEDDCCPQKLRKNR